MESIREISAFLLEPHFHAQAAAKRCRRARLEQRSRSGAEGASCRRRAPSEMHERRHASKSHPLATAAMLKPGQGVLWLQIPAVTQLHPKKKKKKKQAQRARPPRRQRQTSGTSPAPLHRPVLSCRQGERKKDKKKINWSYSRWFVTHTSHRFWFFSPVRLFWGVASWICAVRGCTWGCFAAGKYESGSGVPEHPLPAPEPPHLPTAPSKTLVRGGSLGPGEPSALSRALVGVCKSRHPKSLDIVKKCPNQGANSPLGKCSSSNNSQPPPWAQGNTSGGNSRKTSCKSSSAGAWSCTASATPYLALLL